MHVVSPCLSCLGNLQLLSTCAAKSIKLPTTLLTVSVLESLYELIPTAVSGKTPFSALVFQLERTHRFVAPLQFFAVRMTRATAFSFVLPTRRVAPRSTPAIRLRMAPGSAPSGPVHTGSTGWLSDAPYFRRQRFFASRGQAGLCRQACPSRL
jgi:hypothetical protein